MNRLKIAITAEFELCEKVAECLEQFSFDIETLVIVEIYPFNEEQGVRFNNRAVVQISPDDVEWSDYDYVFFAAEPNLAAHIANAAESGCVVIDMKGICANISGVPVVVPSVNDEGLAELRQRNIVALPDPQVSQAALALVAMIEQNPINQVMVSSLLPASYNNGDTVSKLAGQTARLLNGIPLEEKEQRLAFDVFPHKSQSLATQLQKIFPTLNTVFHSVQVPVFYGMAQKVTALSDYEMNPQSLINQWQSNDFIQVEETLLTPVLNGEKENSEEQVKLHISAVTEIESAVQNGLEFWTVADEQRFNLALLAVALLERIIHNN